MTPHGEAIPGLEATSSSTKPAKPLAADHEYERQCNEKAEREFNEAMARNGVA